MKSWLQCASLSVFSAAVLFSQVQDAHVDIVVRGEISGSAYGPDLIKVELVGTQAAQRDSAYVDPNGRFEIHTTEAGWHQLRVVSAGGEVLHEETVLISSASPQISIRLPERTTPVRTDSAATISARQLAHKVPAQARKAFEKGKVEATKGNHDQAMQFFQQAVAADPEYADAFNALGAEETEKGDFQQAAEHFQKTIDLVPEHLTAQTNLGIVLLKAHQFREATIATRHGLEVFPNSGKLHYLLAIGLLAQKVDSDEVLANLERSARDVPHARLVAAILLEQRGNHADAIVQAEAFLREAPSDDKDRTRATALLTQWRQQ